jgi:predicted Zn-dependent protease
MVNAFAGPDGIIGVYSGLVLATESESELASVLAHEIAHVSQKHLRRTFDAYSRMNAPAAAVILAAVVAGISGAPSDVTSAVVSGVQAGIVQQQINFTRSNEEEADRVGMSILAEAGYDPRAMPVFFERLAKLNHNYAGQVPEFLRTHPVTVSRIADSLGRAEDYPYRQYPDSLDYHLLRTELRMGRFNDPADAVTFFRDSLEEGRYRNEAAQRYGYVLALTQAKRYEQARTQMDRLLETHPDVIAFAVTDARLHKTGGDPERGLERLSRALETHPGDYALTRYYAEDLIEAGRPAEARELLEPVLRSHRKDASLQRLFSRAAGASGETTLAHQHLAEYYYLRGDYEAAIRQLEIALQDRSAEYYQSAQMAARLKELRAEWEDIKDDEPRVR